MRDLPMIELASCSPKSFGGIVDQIMKLNMTQFLKSKMKSHRVHDPIRIDRQEKFVQVENVDGIVKLEMAIVDPCNTEGIVAKPSTLAMKFSGGR